jgi:hypothetical protein
MKESNPNKIKNPNILFQILEFLKKYYQVIWFLFLIILFFKFVFYGGKPDVSFNELNVDNVIFVVWLILLFLPFIKSIDIAGMIRFKTRDEKKIIEEIKEEKANETNIKFYLNNTNKQKPIDVVDQKQNFSNNQEEK